MLDIMKKCLRRLLPASYRGRLRTSQGACTMPPFPKRGGGIKFLVRDGFAWGLRHTPRWCRGRGRLAKAMHVTFGAGQTDAQALRWLRFWHGSRMLIDLRSQTERLAFYLGEYDRRDIQYVWKRMQKDWVVVDVGANVGFWTLALASRLSPRGGVLAIEAAPPNAERLRQVIEANELETLVRIRNVAVGDQAGTLALRVTGSASTGNAYVAKDAEPSETNTYHVPVKCFDDIFREETLGRCDFIKVDIEGYELPFLRGAMNTLQCYRPVILGEFNNYFIRYNGYSLKDVTDLLRPLGYQAYVMNRAKPILFAGEKGDVDNLLLLPEEQRSNWVSDARNR